jgi:signal transduction histidine kinase/CheY-like chemotaxis protein
LRRDLPSLSDDVLADDPRASLRARTQAVIAITAAGWTFWSGRGLFFGDRTIGAVTGIGALLTVGLYAFHRARPQHTRLLAHLNCGIAALFIVVTCQLTGQIRAPALWYLVCLPLCMGYLHGIRTAGVWAAACAGLVGANYAAGKLAPIPPIYVPSDFDAASGAVVLIALTVGLVTGSERVHRAHVAALKQREATIQSLLAGLEKKSEEASVARDQALEASRAKGEFVATLSHEIRTPLNGVLGMAGLLLDDDMSPQQRELVRTIRTSGDALLGLLNDLLDFSKIEAGRLELDRAAFDLRDCVEDAFDLMAVTAARKHLRLAYLIAPAMLTNVIGDGGRVRQILVNLINNAIKFTQDGEVVVELSSSDAGGARELHLAVRDTGIGVAEDKLGSLFEPFTQVDGSSTTKVGGTGLGLAICRRLAEAMGGRVWAESRLGEGAAFHVTLRLATSPPSHSGRPADFAGRRVIVASRHEATRRMLAAQIDALGATALACATAEDVRRELDARPVDALIAEEACEPAGARPAHHHARLLLPWEVPPAGAAVVRAPVRHRDLRRLLLGFWYPAAPSQPSSIRGAALSPGEAPSVLVAEDNPVNQRVVRLMLERMGCRPDVVGNGLEVLDALRARPYDLVLMDVRMPEMDGIAATRALRAELPHERQPLVIAMTANVQVEDRRACEEAGMDEFIPKPIRPADLSRAVKLAQKHRAHPA